MKKLGLFLAALTAVSFASCGSALNAPKDVAPEQGVAVERRDYRWYYFCGKNGWAKEGLPKTQFTDKTKQFLDPKYVGTDTVLETDIYHTSVYDKVLAAFEAAGIPTYDHVRTSNILKSCHFKFNMLNVTALKRRE